MKEYDVRIRVDLFGEKVYYKTFDARNEQEANDLAFNEYFDSEENLEDLGWTSQADDCQEGDIKIDEWQESIEITQGEVDGQSN